MEDNMKLWNSVCVSDPDTVKRMTHGARLNAIDAHSQVMKATELWGPYGARWGLRNLQWDYVFNKDDEVVSLSLDADFFYPHPQRNDDSHELLSRECVFPVSSDIAWTEKGECRKKLMTDTTTKALSKLGFNADVFLNKFSDNRYVDELRKKKAEAVGAEQADARTLNFQRAVYDTGATAQQISFVLGNEGYEKLDEITDSDKRRAFVAALQTHLQKEV